MQKLKIILFLLPLACLQGCHNGAADFPPKIPIEKLHQTDFVPTLENRISGNKNCIYAPTFLYAWALLRKKLDCPDINADVNSKDINLLDNSQSFQNALTKDEYDTEFNTEGDKLFVSAMFSKSLPFRPAMQNIAAGLRFSNKMVKAFGMDSQDEKIIEKTNIVYYQDDSHFIIGIQPADTATGIILVMGLPPVKTLGDAVKQTDSLAAIGFKDAADQQLQWRYSFNPDDNFYIPKIRFNIEADYHKIEGQLLPCKAKNYVITAASQRTAFVLDEKGASVESKSDTYTLLDSVGTPEHTRPKHLVFNKPFYIIIRKKERQNPCFVMYVENTELMEPFLR
jgi:hypothetical protein